MLMPKKLKLTHDKTARYEQRKQTEKLEEATKDMPRLKRTAPRFLESSAKYFYEQLAKNLVDYKLVKNLDQTLLVSMAINYQLLKESYEDVQKNGQTQINDQGLIKKNPAIDTIDKATKNIKALANELGMSPTSRAKIINDVQENANAEEEKSKTMADLKAAFGGEVG